MINTQDMQINDKTTVPFYAVIIAIPSFCAFVYWISFIAYTSNSSAAEIIEIKGNTKEFNKELRVQLSEINTRLSRIENKLETRK